MAELGARPHRSVDIAEQFLDGLLSSTRAGLIAKGMIWSRTHGDTAFIVSLSLTNS